MDILQKIFELTRDGVEIQVPASELSSIPKWQLERFVADYRLEMIASDGMVTFKKLPLNLHQANLGIRQMLHR